MPLQSYLCPSDSEKYSSTNGVVSTKKISANSVREEKGHQKTTLDQTDLDPLKLKLYVHFVLLREIGRGRVEV